jgi:adenosylcobinamide-phosphate synthase
VSAATEVIVLLGALALDGWVGEPANRFHPVAWMGRLFSVLRRRLGSQGLVGGAWRTAPDSGGLEEAPRHSILHCLRTPALRGPFLRGAVLGLAVPAALALGVGGLLAAYVPAAGPWLAVRLVVSVWLLKSTFALRALGEAADGVRAPLCRRDEQSLPCARRALRSLCSRDPFCLNEEQLAAATIESLAENLSDSFVAPLFWYLVGGLPAAVFYRAVNTLDAMIGYRGRWEVFGKAAARLDDLLNWPPARLTALCLWLGAALARPGRARLVDGYRIWRRDRRGTESPNAGHPMALMAGLLGVELAKPGHYRLGEVRRPMAPERIEEAWGYVQRAALVWAVAVVALGGWAAS